MCGDYAIFGFDSKSLKLLLFKRKVEPLNGHWSLIGAFIQDDLSIDEGAKQVLLESTGLSGIYLNQLKLMATKTVIQELESFRLATTV